MDPRAFATASSRRGGIALTAKLSMFLRLLLKSLSLNIRSHRYFQSARLRKHLAVGRLSSAQRSASQRWGWSISDLRNASLQTSAFWPGWLTRSDALPDVLCRPAQLRNVAAPDARYAIRALALAFAPCLYTGDGAARN